MTIPLQHRELSARFESVGGRVKKATVATDTPVEVYDSRRGQIVREVLRMDGLTVGSSVPLLVDHQRSTRSTVGSCRNFTIEGGRLESDLVFASGTTLADETWQLCQQGHLRAVSVGYAVREAIDIPAGQARTIGTTTYSGPMRVATRWTLREISIVPIGADELAGMRCSISTIQTKDDKTMNIAQVRDLSHLRLIDLARAELAGKGHSVIDNDSDMLRSWASIGGLDDLAGRLGGWLTDGYNAAADSTAGIVAEVPLPNYLEHRLGTVATPANPSRVSRGGTAPPLVVGTQYETWRLFKLGIAAEIDEQDILDNGDSLDVLALAMREIGAGFRRVVLDAIWGLILSNPALTDGDDLFSVTRGNLGTDVLGNTGLKAAWGSIAGAVRTISDEPPIYAHENISPSYLIVPPELMVTAADMLGDSTLPIRVRSESRLGESEFLDPRDDTIRSGNGTNWLLAGGASTPSIVLGLLNGQRQPRVRRYNLEMGRWGLGLQVDLSIGVCAVDGRPLYFSTGTNG